MAKKVLIIDDNADEAMRVEDVFKNAGFDTLYANNGFDAYQKVYESAPDLIILDVLMPDMGGYEFCRMIKADKLASKIPVIVYSSLNKNIDKFWAYRSGADGFINKAQGADELLENAKKIIEAIPVSLEYKSLLIGSNAPSNALVENAAAADFRANKKLLLDEMSQINNFDTDGRTFAARIFRIISKVFKYDTAMLCFNNSCTHDLIMYFDTGCCKINDKVFEHIKSNADKIKAYNIECEVISKRDCEINIDDISDFKSCINFELSFESNTAGYLSLYNREDLSSAQLKLSDVIKNETLNVVKLYYLRHTKPENTSQNARKLYSQADFDKILGHETGWHKRNNTPLGFAFIEIDSLENLINTYDEAYCDVLLAKMSTMLTESLLQSDFIYRNEDNVFALILTNSSKKRTEDVLEYIKTKAEDPYWLALDDGSSIKINAGAVLFSKKFKNNYEFIDAAYDALEDSRANAYNVIKE